jgi:hypothetical protein
VESSSGMPGVIIVRVLEGLADSRQLVHCGNCKQYIWDAVSGCDASQAAFIDRKGMPRLIRLVYVFIVL